MLIYSQTFSGDNSVMTKSRRAIRSGVMCVAATLAALLIAVASAAIATATEQSSETSAPTDRHSPQSGGNPTPTPTKTPAPRPPQDSPDDGIYTWSDGERTFRVQLVPSETPPDDKDPYADRSPDDSADVTFRAVSGGAEMTLPGGVIVKLNPDWTRQKTDAFFKSNGIRPNEVRQLQLLDNTFFVETEPGLPSLQLANTLATQKGVVSSIPNWGSEVNLDQSSESGGDHGNDHPERDSNSARHPRVRTNREF